MIVIFDFDGTLANTLPVAVHVLNKLSQAFGYEKIGEDDIEKLRNLTISDFRTYLKLSWVQLPLFILRVREELFNQVDLLRPILGMEDIVAELKHYGVTMGIITSNSAQVVDHFTKDYFSDYFAFVHTGTSLFGKSAILRDVIETYHLDKNEIFYVGDEVRDVQAARAAGIKSISVTWGFQSRALLEKQQPDYLVERPEELYQVLGFRR